MWGSQEWWTHTIVINTCKWWTQVCVEHMWWIPVFICDEHMCWTYMWWTHTCDKQINCIYDEHKYVMNTC